MDHVKHLLDVIQLLQQQLMIVTQLVFSVHLLIQQQVNVNQLNQFLMHVEIIKIKQFVNTILEVMDFAFGIPH